MKLIFSAHLFLFLLFGFSMDVAGQTARRQLVDNLALGNPSGAQTDANQPDNYLVKHNGYSLSYNKSRGAANWVAWHLEKKDIGDAERTNAFAPDTTLPRDWWIIPNDYAGSGFDRGHLCPSKDRSSSEETNRETFLMSNMQPQAPKLNQKTWKYFEDYTREVTATDKEAYIYAGCYGNAGILKDKITIPTNCWKIVVILTTGGNDLKRVTVRTRIIAADMPNDDLVSSRWRTYLTSVDAIEKKTGYDFLAKVPKKIQAVIESAKDKESSTSETKFAAVKPVNKVRNLKKNSNSRTYITGPRGGCYYIDASGKKTYVDKVLCKN